MVLVMQSHGEFTCACDCVAKIASLRLPVEKNHPHMPQSAPMTMGFPLPSRKVPFAQQVSPPPHIQQHIPPHRPSQCVNEDGDGDSEGGTDDNGDGDGATDSDNDDDNDDDGDDSNGVASDDDDIDKENDGIEDVNNDNLSPHVGKRNDGWDKTKTRRRRRSQILWRYAQQSNRSCGGGGSR